MADYSIEVSIPNVGPQGPQGEVGPVGPANELTLGEITTGDAGTEAEATISGTPPNQVLDLVLPRGDTGAQGNPGIQGPGGVGEVPLGLYATQAEAVNDGVAFGGVFRNTNGSVDWIEPADADAAAFIAASGATDRWNIQQFVKGVKALGLWDDMVCWPLRSAQNAGTGTTAYSLGGLGTFNGALVNGPTWGVDGITFVAASSQHITAPTTTRDDSSSVGYVAQHSTLTGIQKGIRVNGLELGKAELASGVEAVYFAVPFSLVGRTTTISGFAQDVFYAATARVDSGSTSIARFYNGGSKAEITNADFSGTPPNTTFIGARFTAGNPSYFSGQIAFAFYATLPLSDADVSDFNTLYKQTLGTGLGLP